MQEILHSLTVEQRKSVMVSGVESVKSFSENRIELELSGSKTRLTITGTGLKISGFSKANGSFSATGTVESVRYGGGWKSRIFR